MANPGGTTRGTGPTSCGAATARACSCGRRTHRVRARAVSGSLGGVEPGGWQTGRTGGASPQGGAAAAKAIATGFSVRWPTPSTTATPGAAAPRRATGARPATSPAATARSRTPSRAGGATTARAAATGALAAVRSGATSSATRGATSRARGRVRPKSTCRASPARAPRHCTASGSVATAGAATRAARRGRSPTATGQGGADRTAASGGAESGLPAVTSGACRAVTRKDGRHSGSSAWATARGGACAPSVRYTDGKSSERRMGCAPRRLAAGRLVLAALLLVVVAAQLQAADGRPPAAELEFDQREAAGQRAQPPPPDA